MAEIAKMDAPSDSLYREPAGRIFCSHSQFFCGFSGPRSSHNATDGGADADDAIHKTGGLLGADPASGDGSSRAARACVCGLRSRWPRHDRNRTTGHKSRHPRWPACADARPHLSYVNCDSGTSHGTRCVRERRQVMTGLVVAAVFAIERSSSRLGDRIEERLLSSTVLFMRTTV